MALLDVSGLTVRFQGRSNLFGRRTPPVTAVDNVSLTIEVGETLGVLGESGSGKSTLGRAILGLVQPDSGHILLTGQPVTGASPRELRSLRPLVQAVFQDPYSSLNPALTVFNIVSEPLRFHHRLPEDDLRQRVRRLLERVGLKPSSDDRFPEEFSGGQRQRIAIARAIALQPKLIIADEVTSGLDASTRGQVVNLLEDLQAEFGIAYLFIGHDVGVVRHVSHRIAVMHRGMIVEEGDADTICDQPRQDYTARLIESVPVANPTEQRERRRERAQRESGEGSQSVSASGIPEYGTTTDKERRHVPTAHEHDRL